MPSSRLNLLRHESPLGRWTIATWAPAPDLAPVVDSLWAVDGETAYTREKILPRAGAELLINLGPPQRLLDPDDYQRARTFDTAWIAGLQRTCLVTESLDATRLMGVRFGPSGAAPVLGVAMSEVTGRVETLDDVVGSSAIQLRLRLLETADLEARFLVLEDFVRARLAGHRDGARAIAWVAAEIVRRRGNVAVEALARAVGMSRKSLAGQFHRHVGVGPKAFARVVRFGAAIDAAQAGRRVNWAEVAASCGYFDQAHFTREFREFTGLTPGEFRELQGPDGAGVVLDAPGG